MRFVGIDPASTTGFVALDITGAWVKAKELTGVGSETPRKIRTLHDEILLHLHADDQVAIEGFALEAADTNKVSSGCNWAARLAADRKVGGFNVAETTQLKKFVNVSEWTGVKGSKKRLKGKQVKELVKAAVTEHWGFNPKTDNIADAYVLAQISLGLYRLKSGLPLDEYKPYQLEVLHKIAEKAS
ncbi:hypothetical protein [Paenibacillus sp. MMO-58]|uniref:hypothetical protein n=1 Tax=Paenibacillus sp. MMO-58 TaxID=3081290 RepID=UPI00301616C2